MGTARALMMAFAIALAPGLASAAASAPRAIAKQDWSRVVALTPAGGFRMGNPAAPIKLVEYGSLACPHCRHFEETGFKPLVQSYVRSGRVSYEFRNLLINGPDISASMLARCSGPHQFFALSQYIFTTQPDWIKRLDDMTSDDRTALDGMTDQERIIRYGEVTGLTEAVARFGMPAARARQCLSDPKGMKLLLDMTQNAQANGVEHTPTFFINGKITDAATWEQLEPLLRSAGGRR